ncbi:MAG: hypothetical protein WDN69_04840 [Aliidongia sp.]
MWSHEAGESLADFVRRAGRGGTGFPTDRRQRLSGDGRSAARRPRRSGPRFGLHPRLQILGTLEARLLQADHGRARRALNEGSWPPETPHDPWLSRPMRKEFGLKSPEVQSASPPMISAWASMPTKSC